MNKLLLILLFVAPLSFSQTIALQPLSAEAHRVAAPALPDISKFTPQWVKHQLSVKPTKASIGLRTIYEIDEFEQFIKGGRAVEWVKRQSEYPQAIVVSKGEASLVDIAQSIDEKYFSLLTEGTFISRLPIVIAHGARLIISKDTSAEKLLLSQTAGAFLLNAGQLFVIESEITGWDEENQQPAFFESKKMFRPFITSQGNSDTYFAASTFKELGYFQSKSYGISFTGISEEHQVLAHENPNAWLINNNFEGVYYGFYSYETEDLVIVDNTYFDNIVYGIDPHDYSKRLIIANNTVHKTRQAHGIIVSRSVNDSWVFNNKSFNNKGSGIVLDRQSNNNVIAYNESYNNNGDGVALFESQNSLLYGNVIYNNKKHGLRVRNSQHVISSNNFISKNAQYGIYLYTGVINGKMRDLELDPFVKKLSLSSIDDQVLGNSFGVLSSDKLYPLLISGLTVTEGDKSHKSLFGGGFSHYNSQILNGILKLDKTVIFTEASE